MSRPTTRVNGLWSLCCTDRSNWQKQPRETRGVSANVDTYRCRRCQRAHHILHTQDNVMERPVNGGWRPTPAGILVSSS